MYFICVQSLFLDFSRINKFQQGDEIQAAWHRTLVNQYIILFSCVLLIAEVNDYSAFLPWYHVIKHADDNVVLGFISENSRRPNRHKIDNFLSPYDRSNLILNTKKWCLPFAGADITLPLLWLSQKLLIFLSMVFSLDVKWCQNMQESPKS